MSERLKAAVVKLLAEIEEVTYVDGGHRHNSYQDWVDLKELSAAITETEAALQESA